MTTTPSLEQQLRRQAVHLRQMLAQTTTADTWAELLEHLQDVQDLLRLETSRKQRIQAD